MSKERHIRATISPHEKGTQIEVNAIGEVSVGDAERVAISILLSSFKTQVDKDLIEYMAHITAKAIITEATQP